MVSMRLRYTRSPVQAAALVVGVLFIVVGVIGFIPGITTHVDELDPAGHRSDAQLFGVFTVSVLHNVLHVVYGVAGIVMARIGRWSHLYFIGGGLLYLALWLYGLAIDVNSPANFMPIDNADNWLHLVLGLGMVALGALLRSRRPRPSEISGDSPR
ncbi:DUF4383 domain-containing protein [Gordonia sp. OPL2]|uniref:DUF4383 domain-containing protein n=1 Tax=Gordonia sp. OPL2 TaxID=2486274 RepID=UPI0016557132|nr:DUF4383 domain-containing protein [Gordonia sp. OPL2]ROZ89159.1 DUF4383 domain-containing protein [Gordonia sp. OPL2]